jgi:hypothetical protein
MKLERYVGEHRLGVRFADTGYAQHCVPFLNVDQIHRLSAHPISLQGAIVINVSAPNRGPCTPNGSSAHFLSF